MTTATKRHPSPRLRMALPSLTLLCLGVLAGACTTPEAMATDGATHTTAAEPQDARGPGSGGIAATPDLPGMVDVSVFAAAHPEFSSYWYQGVAEMNRYELTQARYGEEHAGEAVLIFVTEDFHADRQVKYEGGDRANVVPVLKLNQTRRFYTGVYPYTMMTSVFSPAAGGDALKITMGMQDWCGQVFAQMNHRDDGWHALLYSYFASEGDATFELGEAIAEESLLTWLRSDPRAAPVGQLRVIPAQHYQRFAHVDPQASVAVASLSEVQRSPFGEVPSLLYTLEYRGVDRALHVYLEPQFPHRIVAWRESAPQAGGADTVAVLTHSAMLDYWSRHDADDAAYREALGLCCDAR